MTALTFFYFGLAFAGSLFVVGCVALVLFSLFLLIWGTVQAQTEMGRRR